MKILLIHGLSRTPLSLTGLAHYLQQRGGNTELFGYLAFAEAFDTIVERLRLRLQIIASQGGYCVVTHSLGGVLVRAALGGTSLKGPEHIVMLGPPNQLPRLALSAWQLPPFRWWTGQCGFNLTNPTFFASLPKPSSPYTIIAGIGGPRGSWSPFGEEPNDGIVALSETRLSSEDKIVQLPVIHTFMMNNEHVQHEVGQVLSLDG